jgi:predicted transcriptional regulator
MKPNPEKQEEWEALGASITASVKKMADAEKTIIEAGSELAEAMRKFRVFTGMSQADAAKIMRVTDAYVSQLESGKRRWTPKSVERLLDPILHMTL